MLFYSNFVVVKYALTADITKMYRQVKIDETQRNFQLIVWRKHISDPLQVYKINTITYGTASAPFLAIRSLKYLSDLHAESHRLGSRALASDFYVGDLLTGADTEKELSLIRFQLSQILDSAGFVLTKWGANCQLIDAQLGEAEVSDVKQDEFRTLGFVWNPSENAFKFQSSQFIQEENNTKLSILSFISRLFDPLGFLSPICLDLN